MSTPNQLASHDHHGHVRLPDPGGNREPIFLCTGSSLEGNVSSLLLGVQRSDRWSAHFAREVTGATGSHWGRVGGTDVSLRSVMITSVLYIALQVKEHRREGRDVWFFRVIARPAGERFEEKDARELTAIPQGHIWCSTSISCILCYPSWLPLVGLRRVS